MNKDRIKGEKARCKTFFPRNQLEFFPLCAKLHLFIPPLLSLYRVVSRGFLEGFFKVNFFPPPNKWSFPPPASHQGAENRPFSLFLLDTPTGNFVFQTQYSRQSYTFLARTTLPRKSASAVEDVFSDKLSWCFKYHLSKSSSPAFRACAAPARWRR